MSCLARIAGPGGRTLTTVWNPVSLGRVPKQVIARAIVKFTVGTLWGPRYC